MKCCRSTWKPTKQLLDPFPSPFKNGFWLHVGSRICWHKPWKAIGPPPQEITIKIATILRCKGFWRELTWFPNWCSFFICSAHVLRAQKWIYPEHQEKCQFEDVWSACLGRDQCSLSRACGACAGCRYCGHRLRGQSLADCCQYMWAWCNRAFV